MSARSTTSTIPRSRRRTYRGLAILMGLSPILLFELICVVFDWGSPYMREDPFVGFQSIRPLFVLNAEETRYEIPAARQAFFRSDSFSAQKGATEFRVFCLGGSTVQGRPFSIETSFTTWLQLSLQAADPSTNWRVVNCGGISYASYRLTPILEEVLRYEPDLIVLYTGHNEFLEDREFDHIRDRGRLLNALISGANRLRIFHLMREGVTTLRGQPHEGHAGKKSVLTTEVEARLDYRGGLEDYHRDEQWRQGIVSQFAFNLQRMTQIAQTANVDLLLVNPVGNLCDSPPFKSQRSDGLTADQLAEVESLFEQARQHFQPEDYDLHKATSLLEKACALDPQHAGTWYTLAECYRSTGRIQEAANAFLRAKEEDVCPLRILSAMNRIVLQTAADTGTPWVDAQQLFKDRSPHEIVGGDWLVDHVHPGVEGHKLLADRLARQMVEMGIVRPSAHWQECKERAFDQHLSDLDDSYFSEGMRRLERLRGWAYGRATLTRGASMRDAQTDGSQK